MNKKKITNKNSQQRELYINIKSAKKLQLTNNHQIDARTESARHSAALKNGPDFQN